MHSKLLFQKSYLCRAANDGKTTSKEAILTHTLEINDAWRREAAYRTSLALHAADASYHRDCLANFFTSKQSAV